MSQQDVKTSSRWNHGLPPEHGSIADGKLSRLQTRPGWWTDGRCELPRKDMVICVC